VAELSLCLDLERVAHLADTTVGSESAFLEALSSIRSAPPASLNATALWLLTCYHRYQQWSGWAAGIAANLPDNASEALDMMEDADQPPPPPLSGIVPGNSRWNYCFHSRGCYFTHENGTGVDVGYWGGAVRVFDPYYYLRFLQSLSSPPLPESRLVRSEPMGWFWLAELPRLELAGYLKGDYQTVLTAQGKQAAKVLGRVADKLENEQDPWQQAALAVLLNDLDLALHLLPEGSGAATLMATAVDELLRDRAAALEARVNIRTCEEKGARNYLYEKAGMGRRYVEGDCREALKRRPVDRGVSLALQLIEAWADSRFEEDLLALLESCIGDTTPVPLVRPSCCRMLMGYYHPSLLPATSKNVLLRALNQEARADAGENALLLYLLDREAGMEALRRCVSHEVPHARHRACGALALIGSADAMGVLSDVGTPEAMVALSIMNDMPFEPPPEPEDKQVKGPVEQRGGRSMEDVFASVEFACEYFEQTYQGLLRAYRA